MDLYSLVIENKWVLELFYTLIIGAICMIIVLKTDRFYKLSLHQGIRYFRNAFFFYGIAFIARYILGIFSDFSIDYVPFVEPIFEFFLVMAGFFLLYSLIWRKFESPKEEYTSSLVNTKVAVFYAMALIISTLDNLWNTYYFMFFSQILIFFYASIISCVNYKRKGSKHKFLKFYVVAMFTSFTAWILNFLTASYFTWNHGMLINIVVINVIFFLLFLYGVIKITHK